VFSLNKKHIDKKLVDLPYKFSIIIKMSLVKYVHFFTRFVDFTCLLISILHQPYFGTSVETDVRGYRLFRKGSNLPQVTMYFH